jgi:methionyl-tRNA formyltransferase
MPMVLLIGQGPTALSALESLLERTTVAGVVRSATAGGSPDPLALLTHQSQIPVYGDTAITAIYSVIEAVRPDCVVVSSYDRIIPAEMARKLPFINVHYAPLPKYRGRANVNWAIINGEPTAAISIHTIAPDLDAGNVLFQKEIKIGADDTVTDLYYKLNQLQREHLAETVLRFLGGYAGIPQNESQATYGCTRIPADGEIDWNLSTHEIYALIRGLTEPFPGAYTFFEGRQLMIWRAAPVRNAPKYAGRVPGRVVRCSKAEGYVEVLTGDGVLRLMTVQLKGKPPNPASEVIRSVKGTLGLRILDLLQRIEELECRKAEVDERRLRCVFSRR